jgi:hypothetical protein
MASGWLKSISRLVSGWLRIASGSPRSGGSCQQAAESGHGLYLVSCLAEHLGWHDDPSGRTICAILGTRPPEHRQPEPRGQAGESSRLPQPA